MNEKKENNREVSRNLGRAIKYYREAQGLSLAEVGNRAGISASYLNRLESGTRRAPSIPIIENIAYALGVPVSHLFQLSINGEGQYEQKHITTIAEVLLEHDFSMGGEPINQESKEILATLIETIGDFSWEGKEKNEEIFELIELVESFKETI